MYFKSEVIINDYVNVFHFNTEIIKHSFLKMKLMILRTCFGEYSNKHAQEDVLGKAG